MNNQNVTGCRGITFVLLTALLAGCSGQSQITPANVPGSAQTSADASRTGAQMQQTVDSVHFPTRASARGRANPNMLVFSSYSFPGDASGGAYPLSSLIDDGGVLYGTSFEGGTNNEGTIYSIHPNLTSESVVHSFGQGLVGDFPTSGLLQKGIWLYGTTEYGGNGAGTAYRIRTNGMLGSISWTFAQSNDAANPASSLISAYGRLYGTSVGGGIGYGTVYNVVPGLNSDTVCHAFNGIDGTNPSGSLLNISGNIYGTTEYGGAHGLGTVFQILPNCTIGWSYSFGSISGDGANPNGGLVHVGNKLYGTTSAGGTNGGYGTIFSISLAGTHQEIPIYSFSASGTNGTTPVAPLTYDNAGNFYGTTEGGWI